MIFDREPRGWLRADRGLLLVNVLIVCGTIALIFVSNHFYRGMSQDATLKANSFLTVEWRLLKAMKEQTDQLLQAKDREIAAISRQYRELLARNASETDLLRFEQTLARMEAERQDILSARYAATEGTQTEAKAAVEAIQATAAAQATASGQTASAGSAGTDTALSALLKNYVEDLQKQEETSETALSNAQAENARLQAEIDRLRASGTSPAGTFPTTAGVSDSDALALLKARQAALESEKVTLSLNDVKTRTLLRAIVRNPAVRSEYPTLSNDLDGFFDVYGASERFKGKTEAYGEMVKALGGE